MTAGGVDRRTSSNSRRGKTWEPASLQRIAGAPAKLTRRPRASRLIWPGAHRNIWRRSTDALAEVVRDLQQAGDASGGRSGPRDLFELAFNRLAGEVTAVNRTAKSDAIEFRNQTLADARTGSAREPNQPTLSV